MAARFLSGTVDAVLCVRCLVEFMWRVETVHSFIGSINKKEKYQKKKKQTAL